ncbi:DNA-binding transcriptional MerR regulator [Kibdelosporangium banguiense]|uniref:DNA-binding transcriptional MerR regulator n=1 Tax=Kibdelosporangium banguiense TaxID=1365924 RepID=A0ABS4TJ58_9PSEU|nr:TioE family transcriptional regulator [Kibdelosporangium banguiense]MBP2324359.1 DNA-binding transcriptional MerR regulator [Kibdelosporangium banguiense]
MITLRPADLAREHGLSTQAVRNYERDGFIPPAERTQSGYRIYTEVHAAALRAYLALIAAYGHSIGGQIMTAIHRGALEDALRSIAFGHNQLLRDQDTLDAVRTAVNHLAMESTVAPDRPIARSVGELARQLRVTPATLRSWEDVGILVPVRDPVTGYRVFQASDIRDAELAHLLRRGGYPLDRISTVVQQIRTAGGTETLSRALDDWRRKLTTQGLAMLDSAVHLSRYLGLIDLLD